MMRTKHILAVLALPMAFAACTQDEFESLNGIQSDVNNRPMVGQVTFYDGDGTATRLANPETGTMEFADGDQFGMVLMDNAVSNTSYYTVAIGKNKNRFYELTNNAYTNYPFTKDGDSWKSEAELVEGNYFYYMPYTSNQTDKTKNNVSRSGGLQWAISASQNAYTAAEPTKLAAYNAVKDNQLYIGYEKLDADAPETSLENKMIAAHGTIGFVLKNTNSTALTVKRVVLGYKNNSTEFNLTGSLDVAGSLATVPANTYTVDTKGNKNKETANANLAVVFDLYKNATSDERNDFTKNPLVINSATFLSAGSDETSSISLNFPKDYVLAQGQTAFANMVVPATIADLGNLVVTVYTDKGIMTLPLTVGSYLTGVQKVSNPSGADDFESENTDVDGVVGYKVAGTATADATVALKLRNPEKLEEYKELSANAAFSNVRPNEWNVVTINFGAAAVQIPGKMDIYSTEDLDDFLNYCKLNPNVTEEGAEIEATIKAEGVELTETAYSVLKANDKIKLTVKGDEALVIPAGLSSDVLTRLIWGTDAKAIVKGEQTIAAAGTGLSGLTLTNEGTLTVNYKKVNKAQNSVLTTLYNLGTLNVNTPLAAKLYNGADSDNPAYADIDSDAQMNINANIPNSTSHIYNYANIVVSGDNTEINGLYNYKVSDGKTTPSYKTGKVTINENSNVSVYNGFNKGDITVNGVFTVKTDFTNYGNLYNNYGIENISGMNFTNVGYVKVAATAKFTTLSANNKEVEIMARGTEIEAGATGENGFISYTAVDGDIKSNTFTYVNTDKFTTLKVNRENVTIASTTDATGLTLNVTGDGTYLFSLKDGTTSSAKATSLKKLDVNKNVYMVIASSVTINNEVAIQTGATIQNNSNSIFTYNGTVGDFKNSGTFRNIGTVSSSTCTTKPNGTFTGSGEYPW